MLARLKPHGTAEELMRENLPKNLLQGRLNASKVWICRNARNASQDFSRAEDFHGYGVERLGKNLTGRNLTNSIYSHNYL